VGAGCSMQGGGAASREYRTKRKGSRSAEAMGGSHREGTCIRCVIEGAFLCDQGSVQDPVSMQACTSFLLRVQLPTSRASVEVVHASPRGRAACLQEHRLGATSAPPPPPQAAPPRTALAQEPPGSAAPQPVDAPTVGVLLANVRVGDHGNMQPGSDSDGDDSDDASHGGGMGQEHGKAPAEGARLQAPTDVCAGASSRMGAGGGRGGGSPERVRDAWDLVAATRRHPRYRSLFTFPSYLKGWARTHRRCVPAVGRADGEGAGGTGRAARPIDAARHQREGGGPACQGRPLPRLMGLDCEMALTADGSKTLIGLALVDEEGTVVYKVRGRAGRQQ
jgi:hypothetical protein